MSVPWRKRLLLLLAAAAAAALLAAAGALARGGRPAEGLALAVATLGAMVAALHGTWPRFDLAGRSLRRVGGGARVVALTFDDGPSGDTPAVLDALDAAGVRATFFVLGRAALARPDLVRETARRGHAVALHGHTHARLALAGPAAAAREIDLCRDAIRRAGVEPVPLFRAPHGWKGPFLARALRARALTLVAWTRGAWDSARPGAAEIVARATRRPRPGEILLLHDGCGTPGIDPRRDQTAEAVPEIVRRWREAGFTFVALEASAAGARDPTAPGGKRRRATALGLLAGIACAAAVLGRVDLAGVREHLAGAQPRFLALAVAANCLSLAFQAARWRSVVRAPGVRVRYRDAFVALVAGFAAGLAIPARGGDLVRSHLLARRSGLPTPLVLAASLLDHVVGAVALVAILGVVVASAPLPPWAGRSIAIVAGVTALAAGTVWALRPRRGAPCAGAAGGIVARLRAGLAALHDPRALLSALAWAAPGWVAEGTTALAVLVAVGLAPTPVAAALAVLAGSVAAAVPLAPGSAGSFELATSVAIGGVGVSSEAALAFALAFHLAHLVPVAVLGGAFLLRTAARGAA